VNISPYGGSFTSSNLRVTIEWCHRNSLDESTFSATLNGTPVTLSYTPGRKSGCQWYATSTADLVLRPGSNTFVAEIRDFNWNVGRASAIYWGPTDVKPAQVEPCWRRPNIRQNGRVKI
jgi:hypothetical protein